MPPTPQVLRRTRCQQRLVAKPAACHRVKLYVHNAVSDSSVRIRGDIRKVFKYLTNFQNAKTWDPSVLESLKLGAGTEPTRNGTRFRLEVQPFPTVKVPMTYEVVEYAPPKKLVLSGSSDRHSTIKQFILMSHPTQQDCTILRQVVDIKLRSMIPMLDMQLAKQEEEALKALERCLNAVTSPLYSLDLTEHDHREYKAAKGRASAAKETQGDGGWGFKSMMGGLFDAASKVAEQASTSFTDAMPRPDPNYASSTSNTNSNSSSSASDPSWTRNLNDAPVVTVREDMLGYYQVLGLETKKDVTTEDVKGAFRAAAQHLHPDKQVNADERTKKGAKLQYQILQAAYETLRDPEKRRMYDSGRLMRVPE